MKGYTGLAPLLRGLAHLPEDDQQAIVSHLSAPVQQALLEQWEVWAHAGQRPDESGDDWRVWMIMAGRGYGKTRAGAEWVSEIARSNPKAHIALIGATLEDVRRVMIEGESGILAVARSGERPVYYPSLGLLLFDSGAVASVYAASSYEKLRGPQHSHAWCDELGKWNHAQSCWDNLMLGLRMGDRPRVLATTTPRATSLLLRLVKQDGVVVRRGATRANHNLSPAYLSAVEALYAGSRLGRQELEGELLTDMEGAHWSRAVLEHCRAEAPSAMRRTIVAVDPPASTGGDECGIIVAGLGGDGQAYVLADCSVAGASPERWARAVADAAVSWGADKVIAEGNQGGDMVLSTLRAAHPNLPVVKVHASDAKMARAEPISVHYATGRVHHAGHFSALEDQLCGMTATGYCGPGRSPDRADALIWAIGELLPYKEPTVPRIRVL